MSTLPHDDVRHLVRERYSNIAETRGVNTGCCGPETAHSDLDAKAHIYGYSESDTTVVPEGANLGLGCGNPIAIASLQPGQTVLDLGSGAGFDCFLAARAVGASGHVLGIDMTHEMLRKARTNAETGGYTNVEFRLGEIEHLPVADQTVDVIISNCVINLSPEKNKVFRDAFRVLRPGGRLAVSDVVATAAIPDEIRNNSALLSCCVAGASLIDDVESMLQTAGFTNICIQPKDESKIFMRQWDSNSPITDYLVSATIEAVKPTP